MNVEETFSYEMNSVSFTFIWNVNILKFPCINYSNNIERLVHQ